jgi:hypothetical protein
MFPTTTYKGILTMGLLLLYLLSLPLSVFTLYLMVWDLYHRFKKDVYSRYSNKANCKSVVLFHNISVLSTLLFLWWVLYGLSVIESSGIIKTDTAAVLLLALVALIYIVLFRAIGIQKVLRGSC